MKWANQNPKEMLTSKLKKTTKDTHAHWYIHLVDECTRLWGFFCFFLIGSQFCFVSCRFDFLAFSHIFSDVFHFACGSPVSFFFAVASPLDMYFYRLKIKEKSSLLNIQLEESERERQREIIIDTTWKNHVCYGFWLWHQLKCMCALYQFECLRQYTL